MEGGGLHERQPVRHVAVPPHAQEAALHPLLYHAWPMAWPPILRVMWLGAVVVLVQHGLDAVGLGRGGGVGEEARDATQPIPIPTLLTAPTDTATAIQSAASHLSHKVNHVRVHSHQSLVLGIHHIESQTTRSSHRQSSSRVIWAVPVCVRACRGEELQAMVVAIGPQHHTTVVTARQQLRLPVHTAGKQRRQGQEGQTKATSTPELPSPIRKGMHPTAISTTTATSQPNALE